MYTEKAKQIAHRIEQSNQREADETLKEIDLELQEVPGCRAKLFEYISVLWNVVTVPGAVPRHKRPEVVQYYNTLVKTYNQQYYRTFILAS